MARVSSGSGTFQAESARMRTMPPGATTVRAEPLQNSSGRSAVYTRS